MFDVGLFVQLIAGRNDVGLVADGKFEFARNAVGDVFVGVMMACGHGAGFKMHLDAHQVVIMGTNLARQPAADIDKRLFVAWKKVFYSNYASLSNGFLGGMRQFKAVGGCCGSVTCGPWVCQDNQAHCIPTGALGQGSFGQRARLCVSPTAPRPFGFCVVVVPTLDMAPAFPALHKMGFM
jgi:hypothetical protein